MNNVMYLMGLLVVTLLLESCQSNTHVNTREVIAFMLITVIVILFFALAFYSNVLRDEVDDCEAFDQTVQKIQFQQKRKLINKSNPFSLSKVQFGLWTVIISSSYIYLSLCKGDCAEGPINKTALVLMGIVAGTSVASTIIDKKEITNNQPRHQNAPTQGFFIDILSDDNGISLHRFQSFIWTLIAMTVYVFKVYNIVSGCTLPELSDTLLTLTGISSATYIALRTQENNQPVDQSDLLIQPAVDPVTTTVQSTAPVTVQTTIEPLATS